MSTYFYSVDFQNVIISIHALLGAIFRLFLAVERHCLLWRAVEFSVETLVIPKSFRVNIFYPNELLLYSMHTFTHSRKPLLVLHL